MLTSKPLAAAIAGLLFACAGAAAAEGHVKIFSGYDPTALLAAQPGAARSSRFRSRPSTTRGSRKT